MALKTTDAPSKKILVAGCGFVGLVVARQFHALGWQVTGLTRSAESAGQLASEPFPVIACDINDRAALQALGSFDAVVDCVSSSHGDAESYRQVYLEGARSLIETIRPHRFIFTSSTSVYAQVDGSVVTEASPAEPDRETARILLETEKLVLAAGGHVVRLAGIYGPDRWMLVEGFLAGRAVIEGDGSRILNHIHRDDAAAAVIFLVEHDIPPGIYNVADDMPVTQREAYMALAAHFKQSLPLSGPADPGRKRAWTSKQVSNATMRSLGWVPRFASFRDAL